MDVDNNVVNDAFAAHIKFSQLAKRLENVTKCVGNNKKAELFATFFQRCDELRLKYIAEKGTNAVRINCFTLITANSDTYFIVSFCSYVLQSASLFPILRLLVPDVDREREAYCLKTKMLGKLFVKALAISEDSDDAKKLTYQKTVESKTSDFSSIVHEVMMKRAPAEGTLTVADINDLLDFISSNARSNARKRMAVITNGVKSAHSQ